jgi:tape measure domain-containing protein
MSDTRNTIRWDSVGAEKVRRDYADITIDTDKASAAAERYGQAALRAIPGTENLARSARNYAVQAEVAGKSTDLLNVGLVALGRIATGATILELGRRTILAADSFKTLQNQLRVAGFEAESLAGATAKLFEISNRTQTSVEANAVLYGRLSAAQKALGASSDDLFKFTEAVGNALKINNTEAGAASGALLQLSQAMGGTNIQAEEFNSIVDGMRPLLAAAAKHISAAGGEVSGLKNLVKDGALSSQEFFAAVLQGAQDLEEQAAKAQTNIGQGLTVLKNKYIEAAGGSNALRISADLAAQSLKEMGDQMGPLMGYFDRAAEPVLGVASAFRAMAEAIGEVQAKTPGLDKDLQRIEAFFGRLWRPGGLAAYVYEQATGGAEKFLVPSLNLSGLPENKDFQKLMRDELGGMGGDGLVGHTSRFPGLPSDAELKKAAEGIKDWQDKVAEGWRDMYDKVGKESADFSEKIAKDAQEAMDADAKAHEARRTAINGYIRDLERENELVGLSNQARAERVLLFQLEDQGATDAQKSIAVSQLRAKQAKEAAQREAEAISSIYEHAAHDIQSTWSDLFYGVFNDGKFKFQDFADSLKSIWARTLADMVAMSMQQSLVTPIFSALFGMTPAQAGVQGFGGGTGATGTRGIFDILTGRVNLPKGESTQGPFGPGGWEGGMFNVPGSDVAASMGGMGDQGLLGRIFGKKVFGSSLGELLGGAALGMGLGSMTGSGSGGAIGGALGSMLGPIGGLVGGLLGGFIGSLFKSTPRSISAISTNMNGLAGLGDSYAQGLDVKIGQGMGKSVSSMLNAFASELDLSLDSDAFVGMVGQRGKKFFYQAQQGDIKKAGKKSQGAVQFEDAQSAIAAAVEAALKNGIINGLTDADKRLLEAATDVQQGMQDVIASHNFKKELHFQFIGLSDPLAEQLARLKDWYEEQLKQAEKFEADKTELEAVYNAKRKDLVEQYNKQLYGGLKDFLTSITAGAASPLSPMTRLGLAQGNYSSLSARALAGDKDAIAALQGAAQDYLSAGQAVYASSGDFQTIYQRVVADLSRITGSANPLAVGSPANANLTAVNDNTRVTAVQSVRSYEQLVIINTRLESLERLLAPVASTLGRSPASQPLQNGTIQVGSTW